MTITRKPFWLVWAEGGGVPTCKHQSLDLARNEAHRLAKKCPGTSFVVLLAVAGFQLPEPGPIALQFDDPDEMPF